MVYVKNTDDVKLLGGLAKKLNDTYSASAAKCAAGLKSSLSIGIAASSDISNEGENDEVFEKLYALADKALYNVKENGKNGYAFYEKNKDGNSK